MATGYYLLDRPRRGPTKWYPTRRSAIQGIVIHATAGLERLDPGDDHSAEATAEYCRTTDRPVSWHAGCDTDSVVRLLPASYTAFHCQNNNSNTLGLEISKRNMRWTGMDPEWVRRTLTNAARAVRPWVTEFSVPVRRVTRAQWDAGARGFISHAELDPDRRTDPGQDFPWTWFLAAISPWTPPPPQPSEEDDAVFIIWSDRDAFLMTPAGTRVHLDPASLEALRAAGVREAKQPLSAKVLAAIPEARSTA